jgi:hypothetical protein
MADITRGTEQCCSQIFLAAERKEITYREAMLYLTMRTNRRQIELLLLKPLAAQISSKE